MQGKLTYDDLRKLAEEIVQGINGFQTTYQIIEIILKLADPNSSFVPIRPMRARISGIALSNWLQTILPYLVILAWVMWVLAQSIFKISLLAPFFSTLPLTRLR